MRISDWSSDVCSSDLLEEDSPRQLAFHVRPQRAQQLAARAQLPAEPGRVEPVQQPGIVVRGAAEHGAVGMVEVRGGFFLRGDAAVDDHRQLRALAFRSEEHTSELQSLMRHSYAVFCL